MNPITIAADPVYCTGRRGIIIIFTLEELKSVKIAKKTDTRLQNMANMGESKREGVDPNISAIGIVGILVL